MKKKKNSMNCEDWSIFREGTFFINLASRSLASFTDGDSVRRMNNFVIFGTFAFSGCKLELSSSRTEILYGNHLLGIGEHQSKNFLLYLPSYIFFSSQLLFFVAALVSLSLYLIW